jgi:hypothetical protein
MKVIEKCDIAPLEPMLCSVQAAMALIGRSERFVIDAIATGMLQAVKSDRRTLLVVQSLKDYVASLPAPKLKADNRNRRRPTSGIITARSKRDNRSRHGTRGASKIRGTKVSPTSE